VQFHCSASLASLHLIDQELPANLRLSQAFPGLKATIGPKPLKLEEMTLHSGLQKVLSDALIDTSPRSSVAGSATRSTASAVGVGRGDNHTLRTSDHLQSQPQRQHAYSPAGGQAKKEPALRPARRHIASAADAAPPWAVDS